MPRSTSKMIAKIIQPYRRLGGRGARGPVNTGGEVIGGGGGGGLTGGTFSSIRAEPSARQPVRQAVNRNRGNWSRRPSGLPFQWPGAAAFQTGRSTAWNDAKTLVSRSIWA